jgi:Tfp pilus assembly protein PilF
LNSGLPPVHSFDRHCRLGRALLILVWCASGLISAEGAADLAEATRALYKGDAQGAQAMAEEYSKTHPASAAARLLIARAKMSQGDFEAAYRELEEVLQREPHNVNALYYLNKLCGILSQIEFRELYSVAPNSARVHQLLGESYQVQEDLPRAEEEFVQALAANPRSARVLVGLGDVKRAQSQCEEAIGFYKRAIEIEPRDYDGNYGLGACYLHQAKGETAIDWFRKAAAAEPDSAAVRLALGITYMRTGKLPEAVTELKAAAALEPESRQAYVLMGQAYNKMNQPRESEQAFRKARALSQPAKAQEP